MVMRRWDPWGDMVSLRDAMDSLVADSFVRPRGAGSAAGSGSLAIDVHEEGDDYVVSAPMPGVKPDDVDITVLGDTVRIRAERREQRQQGGEGQRMLVREQRYGSFERMVRLPSPVKSDGAKAEFQDGVLTITLPKTEEAKERRIPVRSGQQDQGQEVPIESGNSDESAGQSSQ